MAEELFLAVLSRSVEVSYLILAVIAARMLLKRAPKRILCILWMVVGLRLICPFDLQSAFSLLPKEQSALWTQKADGITAVVTKSKSKLNKDLEKTSSIEYMEEKGKARSQLSGNGTAGSTQAVLPDVIHAAAGIWLAGVLCMSAYFIGSWHRMKKMICTAVPAEFEGTVFYQCDGISTPFLFGTVSPRIYVPFSVTGQELSYVLRHERAHKMYGDHWMKTAWYMLLIWYWFHPLVWASYMLFGRDMELACDEKVVSELGSSCKKAYSQSLLACAADQGKKNIAAYPVAFGEIGVKNRVKNILNYKKPAIFTILAAAAVCVIVTVCFATKPKNMSAQEIDSSDQKIRSDENNPVDVNEGQFSADLSPADPKAASEENDSADGDRVSADLVKNIAAWAEVYCGRDAEKAGSMLSASCRKNFMDGPSFGWSSPWPWESGTMGDDPNYRILSADESTAAILYYAWTSDPHVTVWHQVITYQYADTEDAFVIDSVKTSYLDEIATAEEYYLAYPDGIIKGTRMDYISNGGYEALAQNVLLSSTNIYRTLNQPETAAISLLNLSEKVKTKVISNQNNEAVVAVTFRKDKSTVNIKMVRPAGEHGIWIPQTDEAAEYLMWTM